MAWLVVVGVLGLALGWFLRSRVSPSRRDLIDYDERAQRAERRLRSVVVERDNERATVLTLRAALRSERQLLDGVAHASGVEPEAFRKTISREYLGRELVVSPASLVDFDFGTNAAAEAEVASLQRLVRAKDAQLAEAREQIHRIRADVESLALAGAHHTTPAAPSGSATVVDRRRPQPVVAPATEPANRRSSPSTEPEPTIDVRTDPAVIDLCDPAPTPPLAYSNHEPAALSSDAADRLRFLESRVASAQMLEREVADLRARLADSAVANDDIRSRIEYRRQLDTELAEIVAELETFRERVAAERPPAVPDEGVDAVL